MSNENGFTLVELIVVIVIIGVLAAVAIPKFTAATGKAKASEIPSVMAQIGKAEYMYLQESNTFVDIPYSTWHEDLYEILGVEIKKGLFSYYVTEASNVGFKAHAKVETAFGSITNTSAETIMDQVDQVTFDPDDGILESYLRSWAN